MARLSVESVTYRAYTLFIENLEHYIDEYDKFVFQLFQNGISVLYREDDFKWELPGAYNAFWYEMDNSYYKGYDACAPNCTYTARVTCYWRGIGYTLNQVTFTTPNIKPPTASAIAPTVYADIRNQSYGSCVAMTLAAAMDIQKLRQSDVDYENFSTSYIFGSDGAYDDFMWSEEAVLNCKTYGSPRWELIPDTRLGDRNKSESVAIFGNASALTRNNAAKQKFTGHSNIAFYDVNAVANAISNYGFFMFTFALPDNFYEVDSTGIVPQPNYYSGVGHSVALIGLTTKNGKKHWIAQNSWGTEWGDGGRCYIPYDWGCGVQSPYEDSEFALTWTSDCYAAWNNNVQSGNPSKPYDVITVQSRGTSNIEVRWSDNNTGAMTYVINARVYGTEQWYQKAVVSSRNATITMDDYTTYQLMIVAVSSATSLCSAQSEYALITLTETHRPEKFYWNTTLRSGQYFSGSIPATSWNDFFDNINAVRVYKLGEGSEYAYTRAVGGNPFTFAMYNQAVHAIQGIGEGAGGYLWTVDRGDTVGAYTVDMLRTEINAVE